MIYNVYSIKDAKTGFMAPTFEKNDGVAMRNFRSLVEHDETIIQSAPHDFSLYRIGTWNPDNGVILAQEPELLLLAVDVLAAQLP